jgi:hypothetical protein
VEDHHLPRLWWFTKMPARVRNGGKPLEIKKVQIAPGMCMKTQGAVTKCLMIYRFLTRIFAGYTFIDSIREASCSAEAMNCGMARANSPIVRKETRPPSRRPSSPQEKTALRFWRIVGAHS